MKKSQALIAARRHNKHKRLPNLNSCDDIQIYWLAMIVDMLVAATGVHNMVKRIVVCF